MFCVCAATSARSAAAKLTQSSWCEEAGEDKQACSPHGLLFLPLAAGGPSQSVLAMAQLGCLFPGTGPSAATLLTPGPELENLSGETRQFFCLQEEATTDGRTTALACSRAVRMAPRLSRCHHAAACMPLALQPAQTHAGCEQPNTKQAQTAKCIFGASVCRSLVNLLTPPFYQQNTPTGWQRERRSLLFWRRSTSLVVPDVKKKHTAGSFASCRLGHDFPARVCERQLFPRTISPG